MNRNLVTKKNSFAVSGTYYLAGLILWNLTYVLTGLISRPLAILVGAALLGMSAYSYLRFFVKRFESLQNKKTLPMILDVANFSVSVKPDNTFFGQDGMLVGIMIDNSYYSFVMPRSIYSVEKRSIDDNTTTFFIKSSDSSEKDLFVIHNKKSEPELSEVLVYRRSK